MKKTLGSPVWLYLLASGLTFTLLWVTSQLARQDLTGQTPDIGLLRFQIMLASLLSLGVMGSLIAYSIRLSHQRKQSDRQSLLMLKKQKHDFANNLRAIIGLVRLGRAEMVEDLAVDLLEEKGKGSGALLTMVNAILASKEEILSQNSIKIVSEVDFRALTSMGITASTGVARVINNLMDNAIHEVCKLQRGERWLCFYCKSNAETISFEIRNPIKKYFDIEMALQEEYSTTGGNGLGLRIVSELMSDLGGTFQLECRRGQAIAAITLPNLWSIKHESEVTP